MKINGSRKEIDEEWKIQDAREGMDLSSLMFVDVHCREPCARMRKNTLRPALVGRV